MRWEHSMIVPVEMRQTLPRILHNGVGSNTTEIWAMLVASFEGDLDRVRTLGAAKPALFTCQYDYTPPLHFAVREGHLELVRYLLDQGALDATYKNHPFMDTLPTMASDREYDAIVRLLDEYLRRPDVASHGDMPETGFGTDFERLVDKDDLVAVERMLQERPELARDELAFWGEGISRCRRRGRSTR
jgi:hypothetical protein